MSTNPWLWSEEHRRYYRYEIRNGQSVCIWDESGSSAAQQQPSHAQSQFYNYGQPGANNYANHASAEQAYNHPKEGHRERVDSISAADPNMASAAPAEIRHHIKFRGTPERGWYETLDSRYRVRTNAEEHHFFKPGRVFAMLWSEPAGESVPNSRTTENSSYTRHPNSGIVEGRFGQKIYCQIRRFVVIRVNRKQHFVEACAITTYGNRGVNKPGCNPVEHTIVYSQGYQPQYVPGEYERGMTKAPIAVTPGEPGEYMSAASRLRFGKTYTIECNVKVRDMGMVIPEHRTMLLRYYQDERDNGFDPSESGDDDDEEEDDDDDDDDDDDQPQNRRPLYYNSGQHVS